MNKANGRHSFHLFIGIGGFNRYEKLVRMFQRSIRCGILRPIEQNQGQMQTITAIREFSSRQRSRYGGGSRLKPDANLPDFKSILRQFYKKAHPDLIRAFSAEAAEANDKSFQVLNGVLSTIKGTDEYPPAMHKTLQFYLLRSETSLARIDLNLRTAGGDSKNQLAKCFSQFFMSAGVLDKAVGNFKWNDEFFQPLDVKPTDQNQEQYD